MNSYEYFLIQKYRPFLNIAYNKSYSIDNTMTLVNFIEPKWEKFQILEFNRFNYNSPKIIKEQKKDIPFRMLDYSILEQNLNIQFLEKKEKDIVPVLSLLEQKIIVFSMLNDNKFNITKYIKFNNMTGSGDIYNHLHSKINNLLDSNILIRNKDNLLLNNEKIKFKLPQKYLNMVFNSSTKYLIPVLNATYTEDSQLFYISIDWLIKNSGYSTANDCRRHIIVPICTVLEQHGLKTSVEIEKDGRKHKAYIIKIGENKNDN